MNTVKVFHEGEPVSMEGNGPESKAKVVQQLTSSKNLRR